MKLGKFNAIILINKFKALAHLDQFYVSHFISGRTFWKVMDWSNAIFHGLLNVTSISVHNKSGLR